MIRITAVCFIVSLISACTGLPKNIVPVDDFELDKYLGTWYEIARYDHRFERGLDNVSATYSLREDGNVKVVNRGKQASSGELKESTGVAKFVKDDSTGHLKVSFFGPFYGSYVIFELDKDNYQYSFVTGNNRKYLWLLSRTPVISDDLMQLFIDRIQQEGYDADNLIMVDQSGF